MDPDPAPPPSSAAASRTMRANRRRDTQPELRVRRRLHALGLRFLVDAPVPGTSRRRRADVLLRGARIAVYIDGCYWHSCPDHQHLPRANFDWWQRKLASIVLRDRDTDALVLAAGWLPVRIWEHEDASEAAARIQALAHVRNDDQALRSQRVDRLVVDRQVARTVGAGQPVKAPRSSTICSA